MQLRLILKRMTLMKNSTIFGSVVKGPSFKQGQKVTQDDIIAAIDRLYDKRFPVVPNARKDDQKAGSSKKKR